MKFPLLSLCALTCLLTPAPAKASLAWDCELGHPINAPLIRDGKQIGSVTLAAGTKITLIQADGEGFLAKRESGTPFHVSFSDIKARDGVDLREVAHDLRGEAGPRFTSQPIIPF